MRLGVRATWMAAVLIPVALVALGAGAWRISRPVPDVPLGSLLIEAPPEFPDTGDQRWTIELDKVEREDVGLVSEWWSTDVGAVVTHEVGQFLGTIVAQWRFRTGDTMGRYEKLFGPELVRQVDPPRLSADAARVFCGNIGESATEELEDCQIWNFRGRYGQYVTNFEIFAFRMKKGDFFRIVGEIDQKITATLTR